MPSVCVFYRVVFTIILIPHTLSPPVPTLSKKYRRQFCSQSLKYCTTSVLSRFLTHPLNINSHSFKFHPLILQEHRSALEADFRPLQLQPHLPHGAGRRNSDPAPHGPAHHSGNCRPSAATAATAATASASTNGASLRKHVLAVVAVGFATAAAATAARSAAGQVHVPAVDGQVAVEAPLSPGASSAIRQPQRGEDTGVC